MVLIAFSYAVFRRLLPHHSYFVICFWHESASYLVNVALVLLLLDPWETWSGQHKHRQFSDTSSGSSAGLKCEVVL